MKTSIAYLKRHRHALRLPNEVTIALGKGIIVGSSAWAAGRSRPCGWCEIGSDLCHLERAVAWWVGDWWTFGEHRYGARREITEDSGWQGPAYQTCANAAAGCRAFEVSRRREVLSFSYHEAVVALALAEQDRLLDRAEREGWSRQQPREAVYSTKSVIRVAVRSIESPARGSITVPATKAVDLITLPRISGAASPRPRSPTNRRSPIPI